LQDLTIVNTDVTQYADQTPDAFNIIQNVNKYSLNPNSFCLNKFLE